MTALPLEQYLSQRTRDELRIIQRGLHARVYGKRSKNADLRAAILRHAAMYPEVDIARCYRIRQQAALADALSHGPAPSGACEGVLNDSYTVETI